MCFLKGETMRKGALYLFIIFAIISFIITGCGEKEKTVEKKVSVVPKTVVETPKPVPSDKSITEEKVLFSFEEGLQGWEIPDWAYEKDDHVAESIEVSSDFASEGKSSLKVDTDFTKNTWMAALIEYMQYFDFSPYRELAVDMYVPKEAPLGLKGKIIITVGDSWTFTEMARSVPLIPGEWVTIRASLEPGTYDWKRVVPDESFRQDVRKIALRVESNKKPTYAGPVYIDSVRIGK